MNEGRFGFRRSTHNADGSFRRFPLTVRQEVENGNAGFLVHMLDPDRAMSRQEIAGAVAKYDEEWTDTAPACANIDAALVLLLECNFAVVEPMIS